MVTPSKLDLLCLRKVNLSNDIYSLIWASEKKDNWEKIHNENTNLCIDLTFKDKLYIKFIFFLFVSALIFTLSLILIQVFSSEIQVICSTQITILRILLVYLAQINLTGEFRESLLKIKYTNENSHEFESPFFAKLVSVIQFLMAISSYFTLLLFICTQINPLFMIMDFTGIIIFVELDDWIGEKICSKALNLNNDKVLYYNKEMFNFKMPITFKLSLLKDYLEIIEDLNGGSLTFLISLFGKGKYLYSLFPLFVLLVEKMFIMYHPYVVQVDI